MPQVSGSTSIHINVPLTSLLVSYQNEEMIGDLVAPILPVSKRSDKYFIFDKDTFLRSSGVDANGKPLSARNPSNEANIMDWSLSNDEYYATEMVRRALVKDADSQIADAPLNVEFAATKAVAATIALDNEIQVARMVGTVANYASTNVSTLTTGTTGTSWALYNNASSNPFRDVLIGRRTVKRNIVKNANTMLVTYGQSWTLQDHPLYKELYKYTATEGYSESGAPKRFRGLDYIEANQQAMTSTGTVGDAWQAIDTSNTSNTEFACIYYRNPKSNLYDAQTFRTFEAPNATSGAQGYSVKTYRDEAKSGNFVEVSVTRAYKYIAQDSNGKNVGAYIITDVPAS